VAGSNQRKVTTKIHENNIIEWMSMMQERASDNLDVTTLEQYKE
jgi:hypothetical protein